MSVVGNTYLNMIDFIKQQGADGDVTADVINLLAELTPVFRNGWHAECNKTTSMMHNILTGLPAVAWGRLYKGIPQGKSSHAMVEDTTGFVEGRSNIDQRLLKLFAEKNIAQMKMNENAAFLEAMAQEFETGFFYHDTTTDPDKFKGVAARYNKLATSGAGRQIVDAGGTGSDNTSIWFITWGDSQTSLIHPKGSSMGVEHEDHGAQRVTDADGNAFYAEEHTWRLHVGCSVGDYRYNARIANIDVSDLRAGSVPIFDFMRKAYYKLKSRNFPAGRQVIYCNADVMEVLDMLSANAGSSDNFVRLRPMEIEGKEWDTYKKIPIQETEALLNTEARIT